jgi:hypothetical protein
MTIEAAAAGFGSAAAGNSRAAAGAGIAGNTLSAAVPSGTCRKNARRVWFATLLSFSLVSNSDGGALESGAVTLRYAAAAASDAGREEFFAGEEAASSG